MHVQIIHCHPLSDSYGRALIAAVAGTLERSGHRVTATDLYAEHFDPVMTAAERGSYFAPAYDETAVTAYTVLLRDVDGLVFCFPQWWFGMPAMLKGYFDRVWAPGIAFAHDTARGRLKPLLTHIRLFGVVTTYGSPWWIARMLAGDPGRKVMLRALRPMCGGGVASFYLAQYDMDRATEASRQAFIERVRRVVARV